MQTEARRLHHKLMLTPPPVKLARMRGRSYNPKFLPGLSPMMVVQAQESSNVSSRNSRFKGSKAPHGREHHPEQSGCRDQIVGIFPIKKFSGKKQHKEHCMKKFLVIMVFGVSTVLGAQTAPSQPAGSTQGSSQGSGARRRGRRRLRIRRNSTPT